MIFHTFYVHPERSFAYIPIGKVASTSIISALSKRYYPHGKAAKAPNGLIKGNRENPINWNHPRHVFMFVRNPFDRLVSLWFNRGKVGKHSAPSHASFRRRHGLNGKEAFPVFAHKVLGMKKVDHHAEVQWLHVPNQRIKAVMIFRFENLKHDFRACCDLLDIKPSLPHEAKSPRVRKHYSHYFDDESRARAEAFYAADLTAYGYSFLELD